MTSCAVTKMRDPLFSVHTTDQGKVILYLEEQDAVVDLATDVITYFSISDLEDLLIANRANLTNNALPWPAPRYFGSTNKSSKYKPCLPSQVE